MKLRTLLASARTHNASDVHVLVGLPPVFRVDGAIVASRGAAVTAGAIAAMLDAALNDQQKERLAREWQLCISVVDPDAGRARVAIYKRNGNLEIAMRVNDTTIRSRADLRLPDIVDDLARKPHGLVILTGPTGVGKTTTLHYMIDLINAERSAKIITIEDPIEYVHGFKRSIVVQQEILADVLDFSGALRHVLRQDPDVIAVGEMRDRETVYTALSAAETGHLVITTLHTPGAVDVVQRLVSTFPPGQQEEIRFILSSALRGVVAQQLLPQATSEGRIVCCEVLIGTQAVLNHIRDGDMHQLYSEMQAGRRHGMMTLDHALLDLYQQGEIAYDTALSMARHPDSIKKRAS